MSASAADTTTNAPALLLDGYGVAFGDKIPLASVHLSVPASGVFVLFGPVGAGKSTLLRSIAGLNDNNPAFRSWGKAFYRGEALGALDRPALSVQSARLVLASVWENVVCGDPERERLSPRQQRERAGSLLEHYGLASLTARLDDPAVSLSLVEQRLLAFARLLAADPALVLLDEPTSGLGEADIPTLLDPVLQESQRRAVLLVLHNQQHATYAGGRAALLAGGVTQESAPTLSLLGSPQSAVGRQFVRTGSCALPAPDADPAELAEDSEPPAGIPNEAARGMPASAGPRGFLWLWQGQLAGTPRPGIVQPLDYDLQALARLEVSVVVTLTEDPPDEVALGRYGMRPIWCPIPDMHAPTISQAWTLCDDIQAAVGAGEVVAVHCHAGLGRTGTVLACCLIRNGASALAALERVRCIDSRWVQSDAQVSFLEDFANCVAKVPTS